MDRNQFASFDGLRQTPQPESYSTELPTYSSLLGELRESSEVKDMRLSIAYELNFKN